MKIEERRKVFDIIDDFEKTTDDDTFGWNIPKLCICHKVAREVDSVVVSGNRYFIAIDVDEDEDGPVDVDDGGDILQVGTKEEFQ
eukprot:6149723-Ditylum_brightwellii.AAC.1